MTMTNAISSVSGRRAKFTPQAIEKIKEFVGEGISRDEIANRLGVTVGSLQVTCSRLVLACDELFSLATQSAARPMSGWAQSALRTCESRRKYRSRKPTRRLGPSSR